MVERQSERVVVLGGRESRLRGEEPVDDHRTLLELARRGEEAEARARSRLVELPAVGYALRLPDWRPPGVVFANEVDVRYVVRAAPLTVTPALSEWPLTRRAADSLVALADVLLLPQASRMPFKRQTPGITPFARGAVVTAAQQTAIGRSDIVTLVADSGGVLGVAVAEELCPPGFAAEPAMKSERTAAPVTATAAWPAGATRWLRLCRARSGPRACVDFRNARTIERCPDHGEIVGGSPDPAGSIDRSGPINAAGASWEQK